MSTTSLSSLRPFSPDFPQEEITELRRRITATRWPERKPVTDASQGVKLGTIQKLAHYWETDYDWRKCEARLRALPQFLTEIDDLDIHFHPCAFQTRGCAAAHRHARVARLDHRAAEDHRAADRSNTLRRERLGCVPPGDPLDAGLRFFRKAGHDRLES